MTVKELIERLNEIEDKDAEVIYETADGYGTSYYEYVGDIMICDEKLYEGNVLIY